MLLHSTKREYMELSICLLIRNCVCRETITINIKLSIFDLLLSVYFSRAK